MGAQTRHLFGTADDCLNAPQIEYEAVEGILGLSGPSPYGLSPSSFRRLRVVAGAQLEES
jgi:hypothetical protein